MDRILPSWFALLAGGLLVNTALTLTRADILLPSIIVTAKTPEGDTVYKDLQQRSPDIRWPPR